MTRLRRRSVDETCLHWPRLLCSDFEYSYAFTSTSLGWHRRILLALAFRLWLAKRVGHLVLSLLELSLSLSQAELSLLQLEVCFTSLTLGLALGINAFPLLLFLVLLVAFNKIGEATDTTAAAADAQHPPANG